VTPAVETVKEVAPDGRVVRTLARERLVMAQTPQGFRRKVLEDAYRWAASRDAQDAFPDDAALVEAAGHPVHAVDGEPGNLKVTVPGDLVRLGLGVPRVGFGYDVHRLEAGRPLVLGGVSIPHERGLQGHSDADVLLHALADAMLGAAGLGDLGRHFPDDDPGYAGADSLALLAEVVRRVAQAGYRATSCDATLVAQEPRLQPFIPGMIQKVAAVLEVEPGAVGIKATTEEGLGFTGGGAGMAAYAVVVLAPDFGQTSHD
jgi:2-C-methyl-D-erythritol 4-phosphate cytidylyltransferase/2-C-methyl-D-erythritol 2,4-cyclodiphosphate synthase